MGIIEYDKNKKKLKEKLRILSERENRDLTEKEYNSIGIFRGTLNYTCTDEEFLNDLKEDAEDNMIEMKTSIYSRNTYIRLCELLNINPTHYWQFSPEWSKARPAAFVLKDVEEAFEILEIKKLKNKTSNLNNIIINDINEDLIKYKYNINNKDNKNNNILTKIKIYLKNYVNIFKLNGKKNEFN